jgi:hypothetical protein
VPFFTPDNFALSENAMAGEIAVLRGGSFAHRDLTVALRGLNDDRDIVSEGCKDHDQTRL